MKMIKISVIMPVYNSQQYIKLAVNSVLNQLLKEIELIMIDDGSTDSSGKICDEIAEADERVKVIHQKNSGISAARNTGIKAAQGEYISFIDNDDEYCQGFLEEIYEYAKSNEAEIVKYGYRVIEDWHQNLEEARVMCFSKAKKVEYNNMNVEFQRLKEGGFFHMIWNGLYKRDFIINNALFFDEDVKKGYEDWIFNCSIFTKTEKCFLWNKVEYNHYQRGTHSTSSQYHENHQLALIRAVEVDYKLITELNNKYNANIDWSLFAIKYFIEALLMFKRANCNVSREGRINFIKRVSKLPMFQIIKQKETRKKYSLTKKAVSFLLERRKYNALLRITGVYYHFIVLKKKIIKF